MHTTRLSKENIETLGLDSSKAWWARWNLRTARMVDDVCGTRTRSHPIGAWYDGKLLSDFQITIEKFTPVEIYERLRVCPYHSPCRTEAVMVNGASVPVKYNEPA